MATCDLTFPNRDHAPASLGERLGWPYVIALPVSLDLRAPVFGVSGRQAVTPAAVMAVPEAPVNLHHPTILRKNDVGAPWQVPAMEPVSIAGGVERAPDRNLRGCVARTHAGHDPAAYCWVDGVSHSSPALSSRDVSLNST